MLLAIAQNHHHVNRTRRDGSAPVKCPAQDLKLRVIKHLCGEGRFADFGSQQIKQRRIATPRSFSAPKDRGRDSAAAGGRCSSSSFSPTTDRAASGSSIASARISLPSRERISKSHGCQVPPVRFVATRSARWHCRARREKPRRRFGDHFVRRRWVSVSGFHHRLAAQFWPAGLWVRIATGYYVRLRLLFVIIDKTAPALRSQKLTAAGGFPAVPAEGVRRASAADGFPILLAERVIRLEPRFAMKSFIRIASSAGRDVQEAHGRWRAKFNAGAFR